MILGVGVAVIIAVLLIYEEIEKHNASEAASAAEQSEADASVYAVEGQGQEITNIPAGGELPTNPLTEAPNALVNEFVGEAN
jgi:hypothetical protein